MKPRVDDFEQRSKHLQGMSDEELNNYFWQLVEKVV
ncbi:MAG TPA: D-ornithine 4,5-aminomutase subunit OraS, partial [Fervidobacterium sp.]|nr:D-ornithine 4,5-aminomutase subunit OraS [Fervidobacterium sp.]